MLNFGGVTPDYDYRQCIFKICKYTLLMEQKSPGKITRSGSFSLTSFDNDFLGSKGHQDIQTPSPHSSRFFLFQNFLDITIKTTTKTSIIQPFPHPPTTKKNQTSKFLPHTQKMLRNKKKSQWTWLRGYGFFFGGRKRRATRPSQIGNPNQSFEVCAAWCTCLGDRCRRVVGPWPGLKGKGRKVDEGRATPGYPHHVQP